MKIIELPRDTRVTVNGTTYFNENAGKEEEDDTVPPFIIGPLNRYTTIELLSHPILFFRNSGDLFLNKT
jgi:hypothetical protein